VREHDACDALTAPLLDVVHGFHAQVWNDEDEPEMPRFCRDYYAHYQSRVEWIQQIERTGWKLIPNIVPTTYPWDTNQSYVKNPQRVVFLVFGREPNT
jgi:hypothetical protein